MEMVMSTIFCAPHAARGTVARPRVDGAAAILKGWWAAYVNRRMQAAAIARLGSMSDRELKDIGLVRSNIIAAVKSEARGWPFSRYQ